LSSFIYRARYIKLERDYLKSYSNSFSVEHLERNELLTL
jgi:hypothetical protein